MALLTENFEAYAVGAFAITNWDNFFNLGRVVVGGMAGGTKGFSFGNSPFSNTLGTIALRTSLTAWWWQQLVQGPDTYGPFAILNGGQNGIKFADLIFEFDQTLAAIAAGGAVIARSAGPVDIGENFFQVNVSVSNVAGFVNVTMTVAVNGITLLSGSAATTITVASLPGGILGFDTVMFDGPGNFTAAVIDEITIDVLSTIGTFPNAGVPVIRVSQGIVEPVKLPSDGLIRASQGVIELPLNPSTGQIRVSQAVIELLIAKGNGTGNTKIYEA